MSKSDLRRKHIQIRKNISEAARQRMSSLIFMKVQPYLANYHHVGVYLSTSLEVDTSLIIQYLFEHHKRVCVPKITKDGMIFVDYDQHTEMKTTKMGIQEPIHTKISPAPELMIVPMLAYNSQAYRLGYGKAYYDTYLSTFSGYKIGICFDLNLDDTLMNQNHDIACDMILTNGCDIIL
jgi:5-formyltetrahydrofolate cyclo-ligase